MFRMSHGLRTMNVKKNQEYSHEVCDAERMLKICDLTIRKAIALRTRDVFHLPQELLRAGNAEKLLIACSTGTRTSRQYTISFFLRDLHVSFGSVGF